MKIGLKYPVLLVHGMGFRDNKVFNYWGRIPKALKEMGCDIHYGYQDSSATIRTNGEHLAKRIEDILAETKAEKVNIIAHSKGGLDSRYVISTVGLADKVASLTTLSTPHRGSKTADLIRIFPSFFVKFVCFCFDIWFRIIGDKKPQTYEVVKSFTTKGAADFNEATPNSDGVYYQSYAFVMKNPFSDIFMWLPCLVVDIVEGKNDGLLTPHSTKWGDFKGVYSGVGNRGISHCDEIDMRRFRLSKKKGEGVSDILCLYRGIVSDLCDLGF